MKLLLSCLILVSFGISWLMTLAMRRISPRIGFVDKPGGRKIHANPKPLGGGVAIYLGMALPMIAGLLYLHLSAPPKNLGRLLGTDIGAQLDAYWSGARQQSPIAIAMLAAVGLIHIIGLLDDRKAMGPYSKLFIQLAIITALVLGLDMRVLTFLDNSLPAGRWISACVTILWICAITNAFNFLDNMDGLSAGVASVCAVAFLIATLLLGQWFVAAALALLLGAMLGFLCHNFPPARIFMGDSGSLVIGMMLGILTVRTTYLPAHATWASHWYAVFAPVIVLALPLYDLLVVSTLRLLKGKNPFVGDTNHFSHRLVGRGMSRRTAVLCLYLVTAATSIAAILLPYVGGDLAILLFAQTILILCMVALLEQHPLPMERSAEKPTVTPAP